MKPADKSKRLCASMARVLRSEREKAGLSMTKVAELSGVTRQMVSFVEKGARIPSLDTMAKLAIALNTTPSLLLKQPEGSADFFVPASE